MAIIITQSSRDLVVAAFNQKNILWILSANMASTEPVAKRTKLVFLVHDF
jgi:hypothetical protein